MYWLILIGTLAQTPNVPQIRTIAEVREALNRFDEMDKVALQAKAKAEAETHSSLPNKERRTKVQERIKGYAALELTVSPPWQDAELSMIENISDDACKPYDVVVKQTVAPAPSQTQIQRGWFDTVHGTKVWGWQDQSTGYIHYYPHEQPITAATQTPVTTYTFSCPGGNCRVR